MSEYYDDDMEEDYEPQYEIVYDGEETVYNHLVKDGIARAKFLNGDTYYGEYRNGKRHGHGVYTHVSGAVYDGEYVDGLKDGQGRMTYPDGGIYEGLFREGKRHGKGRYLYSNNDVYDGLWRNDKKHGAGVYNYACGSTLTGVWSNNFVLHGTLLHPDGTSYSGKFYQNLPDAHGLYQFPTGLSEAGVYEASKWKKDPFVRRLPTDDIESIKQSPSILHKALRIVGKSGIKSDFFEHIHMLKRNKRVVRDPDEEQPTIVPSSQAPNFRHCGIDINANVFITAQPTIPGIKSILTNVQENGFEAVTWLSVRDDPCVYANQKPYHPCERKALNAWIPLPQDVTSEERDEIEEKFAHRVVKEVRWRGGELVYITENYSVSAAERKNTEKSDVVAIPSGLDDDDDEEEFDESKSVMSLRKTLDWVSQEEGVSVELYRTPVSLRQGAKLNPAQVDAVFEALRDVDDRTAVVVCSRTGRTRATVSAAIALATQLVHHEDDEEVEDEDDEEEEEHEHGGNTNNKNNTNTADVLPDYLKAEYTIVMKLVHSLPDDKGVSIKKRLDKIVNYACQDVDNLREAIFRSKTIYEVAVGEAKENILADAIVYLSYYMELFLICTYLKSYPIIEYESENWMSYKTWRQTEGKHLACIVDDEEELNNFRWQ